MATIVRNNLFIRDYNAAARVLLYAWLTICRRPLNSEAQRAVGLHCASCLPVDGMLQSYAKGQADTVHTDALSGVHVAMWALIFVLIALSFSRQPPEW